MKLNVPFYANTPDDTHCYQAGLKMVLKYFEPERDFSWIELEEMTGKKEDKWTWPLKSVIELNKRGYEIINIEDFDYEKFSKEPEKYLLEKYGDEVGKKQIRNSDLDQEKRLAKEAVKYVDYIKRLPKINNIRKYMSEGYIVCCNVNSMKLNKNSGYVGHFVVIVGLKGNEIYLHDPGLPPLKDRKVSKELFLGAWEYPNKEARNLMAFKKIR